MRYRTYSAWPYKVWKSSWNKKIDSKQDNFHDFLEETQGQWYDQHRKFHRSVVGPAKMTSGLHSGEGPRPGLSIIELKPVDPVQRAPDTLNPWILVEWDVRCWIGVYLSVLWRDGPHSSFKPAYTSIDQYAGLISDIIITPAPSWFSYFLIL